MALGRQRPVQAELLVGWHEAGIGQNGSEPPLPRERRPEAGVAGRMVVEFSIVKLSCSCPPRTGGYRLTQMS